MPIPQWALTLSYWLHMAATVAWLGGLAAFSLFTLPLLAGMQGAGERLRALDKTQKRLDPLGWISLAVLTGTGLIQMSANPNYEGFLSIVNQWAFSILLKHIVFFGMVGLSAYITWMTLPELRRLVLRSHKGVSEPEVDRMQKRVTNLVRLNLLLGLIVLVFTAAARSAL